MMFLKTANVYCGETVNAKFEDFYDDIKVFKFSQFFVCFFKFIKFRLFDFSWLAIVLKELNSTKLMLEIFKIIKKF